MSRVSVSGLAFAYPSGEELFANVSFRVGSGACVGIVGANGVGKSTLLRVLAGDLPAADGSVHIDGLALAMAQDVGAREDETVHGLLRTTLPAALARVSDAVADAERELAGGNSAAGLALAESIADWSELGGYQIEAAWDEACRRTLGLSLGELADRPVTTLSGGERKQLLLEALFGSEAKVLLLDEPDNHLDIPAKVALEERLVACDKTILVISHDRELLSRSASAILTLEGNGCWLHPGSYGTYAAAREDRQQRLKDARRHWQEEEQRLRELVRTFKERAKYSPDWAQRAKAMETRWRRFVDAGEPPPPVRTQSVVMKMRGGDSARRVIDLRRLSIAGLVRAFDAEVRFGERVALVGPNGTGKSHLLALLAGEPIPHGGEWSLGPRVSSGRFTQHNQRADWVGSTPFELLSRVVGSREAVFGGLARYGLSEAGERPVAALSGGQRARLEILALEFAGHNLLLLDEPTDNLDLASAEALEQALAGFEGTVLTVSHDRTFLRTMDRFLHLGPDRHGAARHRSCARGAGRRGRRAPG